MATLTVKASARFKAFTPALLHMLTTLARIDAPVPELVITSANDSKHLPSSKHYQNLALDLRSKSFPNARSKAAFRAALEKALGPRFRVLLEGVGTPNEHFHVQVRKGCVYEDAA